MIFTSSPNTSFPVSDWECNHCGSAAYTEDTQTFLKSRLEELCETIRQVSFEDPKALREIVNATVGEIVIGSIEIIQEDREKTTFKDVIEWIGKFGAIVTLSRNTQEWVVPQIANNIHYIQKLLPPSG